MIMVGSSAETRAKGEIIGENSKIREKEQHTVSDTKRT